MTHLYLLFLIIALMVALLTAGIYLFLYQKYKLDILRYYLYHLAATIVMVFFVALNFYMYLNMGVFNNMTKIFFSYTASIILFSAPVVYTNPIFARELVGKKNTKKVKIFFAVLAMINALIGIILFRLGYEGQFETMTDVFTVNPWLFVLILIGVIILFLTFFYCFLIELVNYRKMVDPVRKLAVLYLLSFAFGSYVFIYFDYMAQNQQMLNQKYPVGIFLQPLTLFAFSSISLLYLRSVRKLNVNKSQSIPQAFVLKFNITDREIEIIEMIFLGLSNKEIASKLFLSPSTVRNHISNIFDKTEMPTRGKLIHLIKSFNV